jgi:chemotaxis methyl-accepting protein methylase
MDPLSAQLKAAQLLRSTVATAQQANRTAHMRREKQFDELKREVTPKFVGVSTSWAKGQGPPT